MIRKKTIEFPDYLLESLKALRPPEHLKVSEWCDKYRVLDGKSSAQPGRWNTDFTPYLRGILDAFSDPEIEEIIFLKPTQVGGTEALLNMLAYEIAQDPGPTLLVYPSAELGESISENRIRPMIENCTPLREKYLPDSKRLELQFADMFVAVEGAGSPGALASRPIRYLFLDEVDKYPSNAGREADPISLAKERTKTFPSNKKIFLTSTPTTRNGEIWKAWERAEIQCEYVVPCPFCKVEQLLSFGQIKFQGAKTPEEARELASYECISCKEKISDMYKLQMLQNGRWKIVRGQETGNGKQIAFRLNALYSPWLRFGDVAAEFLASKNYPDKLMNFRNSWQAEPFDPQAISLNEKTVKNKALPYCQGQVPDGTIFLTAGIDVQRDGYFYTVRGWGKNMTSWNISHGYAFTESDIIKLMSRPYYSAKGQAYPIELACMDSGDGEKTEEVYEFCVKNADWAVAIKGMSRVGKGFQPHYSIRTVTNPRSKSVGSRLVLVNTKYYKDMISARMNRPNGEGSWHIYQDCDEEYIAHMSSEHKILEKNGGEVWVLKSSHTPNHYWDCEVYAACAADLLGIEQLFELEFQEKEQEPPQEEQGDDWISLPEGSWL